MPELSPGQRFRDSLLAEKPLQIAGTINAFEQFIFPELELQTHRMACPIWESPA